MKYVGLIFLSFLSFNANAAEIKGATSSKNLDIYCGNTQDGSVRLIVKDKAAAVYTNDSPTRETIESVSEEAGGDYAIKFPNDIIIRLSKEALQATVYKIHFPPYSEIAFKRVNCNWSRK